MPEPVRPWIASENSNPSQITVTDRTASGPQPDGGGPTGNVDWGSITGTPTSAAGYGIVNGDELDGFAAITGTGIVVRTADNTYATRSLTAGDNVSITNGSGVGGSPTISVPSIPWADITSTPTTLAGYGITDAQPLDGDLTAIAALTGTGYARRTGADAWTLDTTIPVSAGGTGITSYASGDLLYGNGGGTLSTLSDPGLPGYVLANGPSWVQLSTLTATTITGTANQVLVNGTSGSTQTGPVTLTLPQDIHTGATPQFAGIGLGAAWDGSRIFSARGSSGSVNIAHVVATAATYSGSVLKIGSVDAAPSGNLFLIATGTNADGTGGSSIPFMVTSTGVNGSRMGETTQERASFTYLGVGALTDATRRLNVRGDAAATNIAHVTATNAAYSASVLKLATVDTAPSGNLLIIATGANADGTGGAAFPFTVTGAGNLICTGSLTTAAPSGSTAQPWKFGAYTAGVAVQAGTVRVEINGTPYDLLTA